MSPGERILNMMGELEGMRGQAVLRELQRLDLSVFILDVNYTDLRDVCQRMATDPQADTLIILRNRDQLQLVMMHIARPIHNFVAAVMSLREHTYMIRNVWNKRADGKPFPDLQARLQLLTFV